MKTLTLPWKAWHGDESFGLFFPESWDLQVCSMAQAPQLTELEIQSALRNSIGGVGLSGVSLNPRSVAIVVDDITRPTPTKVLLPLVLDQLAAAGIARQKLKIIVALGSHAPLSEADLARKLGAEIVREYNILQHDPLRNLAEIGIHLDKIPVRINKDFLDSDLKISMGCITPHPFAGFSGGGKLILPGLASMEVIERTHRYVVMGFRGGMGIVEGNQFREEVEEVCRKCGLDLIVDTVVNQDRQVAGVFVGDFKEAFMKGVKFARQVYRTPLPLEADVAVLNAYPKDTDLIQSENAFNVLRSTPYNFVNERGKIVLVTASSHGRGVHGIFAPGGRLYRKPIRKRWLGNKDLIIYSPAINEDGCRSIFWEGYRFCTTWNEVLEEVGAAFPGHCKVAVFPCASLQLGVNP
jgi:nickel-dependent lactate racemase